MEKTVLLGLTNNNEVVFANVSNSRGYFSVSFDCSYPQAISCEDEINAIESYIECMDKDWVLGQLESYDCKPSELAEEIRKDTYNVIESYFDNSLYTESFQINGIENDIYFLASGGGQYDTREEGMSWLVDEELYNFIHEMWDDYHLKEAPQEMVDELFQMIDDQNNRIDDYKVIERWLQDNFRE